LDLGAIEWPSAPSQEDLGQQLAELGETKKKKKPEKNLSLFDFQDDYQPAKDGSSIAENKEPTYAETSMEDNSVVSPAPTVYEAVLPVLLNHLSKPMSVEKLSKKLDVSKQQLNKWLKKAVGDGAIKKLSKPVRYEKTGN